MPPSRQSLFQWRVPHPVHPAHIPVHGAALTASMFCVRLWDSVYKAHSRASSHPGPSHPLTPHSLTYPEQLLVLPAPFTVTVLLLSAVIDKSTLPAVKVSKLSDAAMGVFSEATCYTGNSLRTVSSSWGNLLLWEFTFLLLKLIYLLNHSL